MSAVTALQPVIESLILTLIAYKIVNRILYKTAKRLFCCVLFLLALLYMNRS